MKGYILLLCAVATTLFGKAQYPTIYWERAVNSGAQHSLKEVSITGAAVNQAGHTFIIGDFRDSIRPDYNNPSLIESAAGYANFIARYDANGNLIWFRKMTGVKVQGITLNIHGELYITGRFDNTTTVDFDLGPGTINMSPSFWANAFFIAKYDENANYIWAKVLPKVSPNAGNNSSVVRVDSSLNIYLGGSFTGSVDMDPGAGSSFLDCSSCDAGYYAKYDSLGNLLWARKYHNTIQVKAIEPLYPSENVVVGSQHGFRYVLANGASTDSVLASEYQANITDIATDNVGNIYFAGGYSSIGVDFNWGTGTHIFPATLGLTDQKYFIVKYNSSKVFQWANIYELDSIQALVYDFNLDILSSGHIMASFFGNSGGTIGTGLCELANSNTHVPVWSSKTSSAYFPNTYVHLFKSSYSKATESTLLFATFGTSFNSPTQLVLPDMNGTTSGVNGIGKFGVLARYANCVSAPVSPGTITGTTQICNSSVQTYSVAAIAGATSYNWTLPAGWTGTSVTNSIIVTPSANGGTVSVSAQNTCGSSAPRNLTVNYGTPPAVTANASSTSVCTGNQVTLTGGGATTYSWSNGVSNGVAFTPASTQTYTVTGTQGTCSATASVTVLVNPLVTPSVSISALQTTICAGTSVTFTATPTNGGITPVYQWKLNGANVGNNSATYNSSTLVNGNVVTCVLTSNANCASPTTATSNSITMTVNPLLTPSVSISATQTTICSGNSVTFTATPTNGGASPSYQWKVNGSNVGTNSSTYTSSTLNNGNTITCVLTSNANCASPATATSNSIAMTVNALVTPSVSISASQTTICAGTNVTFNATAVNGGAAPVYQWKVNGNNVGTNSASYSSSSLSNNDVVSCVLTSNANCASPATATSNSITMTVNALVTPSVSISASQTTICAGTSVTLNATPVNGGAAPVYQWKVNGNNTGTNSASYSSSTLSNNDVVTCMLTSNANCASPTTATSNSITMTVNALLTPSVNISSSQTTVCAGTSVTFTATPTNGGAAPVYQWKVNGNNVGANSNTYTNNSLTGSDVVVCELISSEVCATTSSASSQAITISVTPTVTASVVVAAGTTSVCNGQPITLTATPLNGGASPLYQWKKNNANISGATSASYTDASSANSDVYKCEMTSNASCVQQPTVLSNEETVTVNTLPDVTITQVANELSVPAAATYQWFDCGTSTDISGATAATYSATANGSYAVRVSNSAGCADTSECVNVTTVGVEEISVNNIQVSPNPFQQFIVISWLGAEENPAIVQLFDATGRMVWNGRITTANYTIDLSEVSQGAYLLYVKNDERIWTKRLVKE